VATNTVAASLAMVYNKKPVLEIAVSCGDLDVGLALTTLSHGLGGEFELYYG
jgi:hypothetical protein